MKNTSVIKEFFIIACFMTACILFGIFANAEYQAKSGSEYIDIKKNAMLYINDDLVCIGDINKYDLTDIKYGDKVSIKTTLDNERIKNPVITFNNNMNLGYRIKIDGKEIASVGTKNAKNEVVCNNQIHIPLNLEKAKAKLEITLVCLNDNIFVTVPRIICINLAEDMPSFITSNLEYIIIGFGLIQVGLLCILFMCINMVLKIVNIKIFYIAMTCVSAGVWIVACYQIIGTIINNPIIEFYMEYMGLAATILFISLYVRELYDENIERKILFGNVIAVSVIIITMSILQKYNFVYMNDSVVALQLCFIPPVVLMMKKIVINMKEKNRSLLVMVAEVGLILGVLVYYLMVHYTKAGMSALDLVILAIMIVLIQAISNIITEMQDSYRANAERKSIVKLAFIDTLTGLSNRRGLEKYIGDIALNQDGRIYKVCSFDLNKLKKINDTYGHFAGDILIKSFSEVLKESLLRKDNFVGRMGGDEFIAIISDEHNGKELDELKKNINEKNKKDECTYKIKYSVGVVDFVNDGSMDIQDAIRMADYAMYEMKSTYGR